MKVILDYIWIVGNDIKFITKIIDADFRKFDGIDSYFGKTPRFLNGEEDANKTK